jgi:hypothetical membrane protein
MPERDETVMEGAATGAHASSTTATRVLAGGGVAGPLLFSSITILSAALRPDYSHISSFISELGASGTPHARLMNYLGFVPAGLLLAAFGIALARVTSRRVVAVTGSVLVGSFGVGVAASGVFSCDPGCPVSGGSVENAVHNAIGPAAFVALACGVGLLGHAFRRLPRFRTLSRYSVATSILGLLFIAALVGSLEGKALTGLWQRLFLVTLFLWCAVVGVRVLRQPGQ